MTDIETWRLDILAEPKWHYAISGIGAPRRLINRAREAEMLPPADELAEHADDGLLAWAAIIYYDSEKDEIVKANVLPDDDAKEQHETKTLQIGYDEETGDIVTNT